MKRMLYAAIVLGWIPTLAVVTGARWMAGEQLRAQGRTPLKVIRIYTGPDGKTKAQEYEMPLKAQGRGTELSETFDVTSLQFRRTNQEYFNDWHQAPRRQFAVTLAGEREIELEGGQKLRLGPGSILLAEDTTGKGHILRHVGSRDAISLTLPLADSSKPVR